MDKSRYIVSAASGEQVDLTHAHIIRSNNLYPFGLHNYAIYETPEGIYVKATNTGEREIMLNRYDLLDEATARNYSHPHFRTDD